MSTIVLGFIRFEDVELTEFFENYRAELR